jgi:hypothetical protein
MTSVQSACTVTWTNAVGADPSIPIARVVVVTVVVVVVIGVLLDYVFF